MYKITMALLGCGLTLAPQALALDEPYMWGVGPRIGTIVIPGQYPITFPTKVENYNFLDSGPQAGCDPDTATTTGTTTGAECDEKRDLDENGDPLFHDLKPVRTDVNFGADFVFYLNREVRVGALTYVGFAERYLDMAILPKVDAILLEDQIDVYAGGGLGFGYMRFNGNVAPEVLKVPYYPIRGEIGALIRTPSTGFQLGLYAQSSVPGNQSYVKADGELVEGVGSPLSLFSYLSAGLEFSVLFGDFEPPKKKKKKKKKKKGGGGGGGNDGGGTVKKKK